MTCSNTYDLTASDVKDALPALHIENEGTEPTESQVTKIIQRCAKYANAHIRAAGYSAPVVESDPKETVKEIVLQGACWLTLKAALYDLNNKTKYYEDHKKFYFHGLEKILKITDFLYGATKNSTKFSADGVGIGNDTTNFPEDEDKAALFEINSSGLMDQ